MNKLVCVLLVSLISNFALAGAGWPAPTDILQKVSTDLDKDGAQDDVFLAIGEEDLSVWIYLSSNPGEYVEYKNIVVDMSSDMVGFENSLSVAKNGSILVTAVNDSIGRNRFEQTLTLAYRKGQVVLAGFTYSERDTLTTDAYGCDLNLLSAKGTFFANDVDGTVEINQSDILPLAQWNTTKLSDVYVQKYCIQGDAGEGEIEQF